MNVGYRKLSLLYELKGKREGVSILKIKRVLYELPD